LNKKELQKKESARNLAVLGLLTAPWVGFLAVALRPNPRQMWAQKWPTIVFVGLYQIALDRCVEVEGLENLPASGPVILAGNHINKTAMDAMLMGTKILIERGGLAKFVSQADHTDPLLNRLIRLMGNAEGVILPINKAKTTERMIEFLRNPQTYNREQPILGIFPAGYADTDFATHMNRPWHTSAAVASIEAGVPIVPFYVEGLPCQWGPMDMLKAVARSVVGGKAFEFKARLGKPIYPQEVAAVNPYTELTERVRQAVLQLAANSAAT
jgi:1-acyl-sn-glycerol-3-phosphate acyltransferase